jgi:hypothetical protein
MFCDDCHSTQFFLLDSHEFSTSQKNGHFLVEFFVCADSEHMLDF